VTSRTARVAGRGGGGGVVLRSRYDVSTETARSEYGGYAAAHVIRRTDAMRVPSTFVHASREGHQRAPAPLATRGSHRPHPLHENAPARWSRRRDSALIVYATNGGHTPPVRDVHTGHGFSTDSNARACAVVAPALADAVMRSRKRRSSSCATDETMRRDTASSCSPVEQERKRRSVQRAALFTTRPRKCETASCAPAPVQREAVKACAAESCAPTPAQREAMKA
jgi:hypothetical protein